MWHRSFPFFPPFERTSASIERPSHDITEPSGSNRCCLRPHTREKPLTRPHLHTGFSGQLHRLSSPRSQRLSAPIGAEEYLHQLQPVRPRNSPFSGFHKNVLHPPSFSLFLDILRPCDISALFGFSGLTVTTVEPENEKRRLLKATPPVVAQLNSPKSAPPANSAIRKVAIGCPKKWLELVKWRHQPICMAFHLDLIAMARQNLSTNTLNVFLEVNKLLICWFCLWLNRDQ